MVPGRVCEDCCVALPAKTGRGPSSTRCEGCRLARRRQRGREYAALRDKEPHGSKRGTCTDCGKIIWLGTTSSPSPVCQPCRRARRELPVPCPVCGTAFVPQGSGGRTKTCSPECAKEASRPPSLGQRTCLTCGKDFKARLADQKYCSRPCRDASYRKPGGPKRWYGVRHLPPHLVFLPIQECTACGDAFLPRALNQVICGEECRRARQRDSMNRRYREDPEYRQRVLSASHNRRADKLGLEGIASPRTLVSFLMERDRGICGICWDGVTEKTGPMRPSIDHIVPLARGGAHEIENLQLAHYRCNLSKGARVLGGFLSPAPVPQRVRLPS